MQPKRLGKYEITGNVGRGAMGEVFRAHDPVLDRDVAIKVLSGTADEQSTQRFLLEAKAAAGLNHPNIITVHDFGEQDGLAYMAMELLEGRDLREAIEKKATGSLEDRLAVMDQVLEGMAFAHARGLVHRDLKPGNVRVLPDGKVKVLDFGLARRAVDAGTSDVVRGTPYYMSPEQVSGGAVTAQSDVFSLGAMFYELLSGRRPFPGATIPAVLYSVVNDEPAPLGGDATAAVAAVIARAMQKDPAARFADAGAMREALLGAWVPGVEAEPLPADLENPSFDIGPALDTRADATAELRALLYEVTQYLDDHVPPLFVSDSVVALVETSPGGHGDSRARVGSRPAPAGGRRPDRADAVPRLAQAEHGRDPEPDREGPARREAAGLRRAPRRGLRRRRPRALPRRARRGSGRPTPWSRR